MGRPWLAIALLNPASIIANEKPKTPTTTQDTANETAKETSFFVTVAST